MRRDAAVSCLWGVAIVLLGLSAGGCELAKPAAPAAQSTAADLKDQMRQPWAPLGPEYPRDYLVCGPFLEPAPPPTPAGSQPTTAAAIEPAAPVDHLAPAGGEANVRPQKGQTMTAKDGTRYTWVPYSAKADLIDVREVCPAAREKPCVVYAYATIHRDSPGKAVLSLASRAPATVYWNGKVVLTPKDRSARPTVSLAEGDNALLVRIAGGGDRWTFTLGVRDQVDTPTDSSALLRPSIVPPKDGGTQLAVTVTNDNRQPSPTVTVEVRGPGRSVATAQVPRGQTHTFETAAWADGPYEIRALARTPDGKPITQELTWYKGDWKQGVADVLKEAERLPGDSDDPVVLKKRLARDILRFRLRERESVPEATTQPAEGAELGKIILALLEYHEAEPLEKNPAAANGFCRLAWRDEVDGSPQFARLYVPPDYDPAKKYPMVVYLHGRNSRNPEYADDDPGTRHRSVTERYGIFRLEPHGRGNTGYQGIGEADVMHAVALARQKFSVDADRIYLMGQSMGGGGAWYVGTRHTDVFAALAPVSGGWDYHLWTSPQELAAWSPQRLAMEEGDSSFAQAESLLNTPVFVNHGDSDRSVNVENSRYAVRMLQRWGYNIRYQELPGKGHTGWSAEDAILEWFLPQRLCRNPRHVRLRAPALHGANAHWVHAEQQEDPFAFMLVDAAVTGGDTIILWSQNVLQVRLNPAKDLLDTAKPFRVIWNGQAASPQVTLDGQILLRAKGYVPGTRVKKGTGPTPFAIVVGTTSKDERMRRFCRLLAERARDDWKEWQHVEPRYFTDTEITDEQIRKYSLALFGGPEDNAVTARLSKDLPLTIEPNRVTIDGRAFDITDAAVRMVYPHPLNADRDVCVVAANSADAMSWGGRLPDQVDYVIDDGRIAPEEDYFRNVVAWGRFDHDWRLNEKYLIAGDPSARAQLARRKAPTRLSLATAERAVMLSDVLETKAQGNFRHMTRDLNWQGKPITLAGKTYAKGIAVNFWDEPCLAAFDLSGGNWKRLRATLGIEIDPKLRDTEAQTDEGPQVIFGVRGDGKELYKSPPFGIDSKPVSIDVDVSGVKNLELEVLGRSRNIASSIDWADVRLEK
ncbi:MAG: NPCBM/NEW2 domain-containing protein [Phycisphaerae bacterium]|nr:NPCBM/NEW2 domain-containing protein [Phycisphaerae bacterium]